MATTGECNPAITAGRLSKAVEFLDAAESLDDDKPNAAGDLFVDAGIAASDVLCCIRLGIHSSSGSHNEAANLLGKADKRSEKHLIALLSLKQKAAYTHQSLSADERKKMNRAATHLVEVAKRAVAAAGPTT